MLECSAWPADTAGENPTLPEIPPCVQIFDAFLCGESDGLPDSENQALWAEEWHDLSAVLSYGTAERSRGGSSSPSRREHRYSREPSRVLGAGVSEQ